MADGQIPTIRVLSPERAWLRNLARQGGLAAFVLGIALTSRNIAFGLALAATAVATAVLMRVASAYQVRRFRQDPTSSPATRAGVAGTLETDDRGIRWIPRRDTAMGSTIDLPWAEVSEVTIQPLAGLVQASRVAFGAATDRSFVVNAPADELTARIERALP